MAKQYQLKSIKRNRTSDFLSISAFLFLDHRRIGSLTTCPDMEAFIFQFELPTDRIVFENFIADWWSREVRTVHLSLVEKAIKSVNPAYDPAMVVKLRCWIKSMVRLAEATSNDHNTSIDWRFA